MSGLWTGAKDGEALAVGPSVDVLVGPDRGKYPHGNSLVVRGADTTVLVDPSLDLSPPPVDRVLLSHCHEDHVAGLGAVGDRPVAVHHADLLGLRDVDGLMEIYGMDGPAADAWRDTLVEQFHYTPRPDAATFADGEVFDLGGGVTVTAVHLPGHTRGHTGFLVEPDGVLYLGDIELSGFGPYYGDAWSDLEEFERSIARCRDIDARVYATFHHKGVIEGRPAFVQALDAFAAVIDRREARIAELLAEPRTLEELAASHIVYRPGADMEFVAPVERRTCELHLARMQRDGQVVTEGGRFRLA